MNMAATVVRWHGRGGPVDLELGEDWDEIDPDERRQRLLKAPRRGDDNPVGLTVRQCAAIVNLIGGAINGHDMRAALIDIEAFLTLAMANAALGPGVMAGDLTERWERVDSWPVPPAGGPRPQPDPPPGARG